MSEEATLEPTEIAETEVVTTDVQESQVAEGQEPAKATESQINASEQTILANILRREKETLDGGDPFVFESDEEHEIYEKYTDGKLKPGKAEAKEEKEDDSKEESEKEPEAKAETPQEINDLLKLTGAKDQKDLVKKVKDLANVVSTSKKEYESTKQKASEYETKVKNETALWSDFNAGKPDALKYALDNYGVVPKGKAESSVKTVDSSEYLIDKAGFLDDETAGQVNGLFKKMQSQLEETQTALQNNQTQLKKLQGERETEQSQNIKERADRGVLNDVYEMAQEFKELKDLPELKKHVKDYLEGNNSDELFTGTIGKLGQVMEESRKSGEKISLKTAFKLLKAENSDLLISEAEQNGRKKAFTEHQPSNNLSTIQKGGESSMFRNYTDDQIAKMEDDPSTIPNELYDDNFDPLPKEKMSKKLWKMFGYR
jgi:hypothetical protein